MATTTTFDYGGVLGPLLESPTTDMKSFSYGSLRGPVVGVNASGGGGTVVPALDGEMLVGGFLEMSGGL